MQVKKFEAKTMKDAISMVKHQLGPDAIILAAKESSERFGLAGQRSVEVTAAVSQSTLQKKKFAERKLNESNKSKYEQMSVRAQRRFIEKVVDEEQKKQNRPSVTQRPYIEIADVEAEGRKSGEDNIKQAAESAYMANASFEEGSSVKGPYTTKQKYKNVDELGASHHKEVISLRNEIFQLKNLLKSFSEMPQAFAKPEQVASNSIPSDLVFMDEKLETVGLLKDFREEIINKLQKHLSLEQLKSKGQVNAWVAKYFLDHTVITGDSSNKKYQVFVGPRGHGKTSMLVNMAAHLSINEKKRVAIITTDSLKIGSKEQLRIYAQILNVPFAAMKSAEEWASIDSQLGDMDYILVDTPGFTLKRPEEIEFLRTYLPGSKEDRNIHFVQSIQPKDGDAFQVAENYLSIGFDDVIFTKLDECSQHGFICNFQREFNVPIHSFGLGPNIPEDFELATKERVVDLLFKLSKIKNERRSQ